MKIIKLILIGLLSICTSSCYVYDGYGCVADLNQPLVLTSVKKDRPPSFHTTGRRYYHYPRVYCNSVYRGTVYRHWRWYNCYY